LLLQDAIDLDIRRHRSSNHLNNDTSDYDYPVLLGITQYWSVLVRRIELHHHNLAILIAVITSSRLYNYRRRVASIRHPYARCVTIARTILLSARLRVVRASSTPRRRIRRYLAVLVFRRATIAGVWEPEKPNAEKTPREREREREISVQIQRFHAMTHRKFLQYLKSRAPSVTEPLPPRIGVVPSSLAFPPPHALTLSLSLSVSFRCIAAAVRAR